MTSLYFRLAGPLQSWAGPRISGNIVRTEPHPTLSGLQGLVAAACGFGRDCWPSWIAELRFSARVDNPGSLVDDFQTINPRDEDQEFQRRMLRVLQQRPPKLVSFTPDGQSKISIVRRTLLAGAEFTVRVSSSELTRVAQAFFNPQFSPYLGRRAFAPVFPFVLGMGDDAELSRIPVVDINSGDGSERAVIVHHLLGELSTQQEQVRVPVVSRDEWLRDVGSRLRRSLTDSEVGAMS